MKGLARAGFTLVEVVMALGIVAFALITIMALLPIGMTLNRTSADELHASNLLTVLGADLQNTDPRLSAGRSLIFGLRLPYQASSSGKVTLDSTISPITAPSTPLPSGCTALIDNFEKTNASPAAYQVSVIYTSVPAATPGVAPIQARVVVNWPGLGASAKVSDLTDMSKVKGYVETCITFPAP